MLPVISLKIYESLLSPTVTGADNLCLQAAMSRHGSQFVWFRVLYVVFSRYMVVNSYKPILKEKTNGHS